MSEAAWAMTGPNIRCSGYLIGLAGGHHKSRCGCERRPRKTAGLKPEHADAPYLLTLSA